MPKNLKSQEKIFFSNECKVSPLFEYYQPEVTQKYVAEFPMEEDKELFNIAVRIIEGFLKEYGSEEEFIKKEGKKLK